MEKENIKSNLFKKILKRVGYFVIGFIAIVLIFLIGIRVYFTQNKGKIVAEINQKINENTIGHVSIGDVSYKFLVGFPNFTVVLNKVELQDSLYAIHKRSVLKANELEVRLNVLSLMKDKIDIEKLVLNDVKVDLFTDKNGVSNSNILKPSPKPNDPKTEKQKEINDVEFNDVVFISENIQSNKLFHFQVNSLNSKIKYTEEGFKTNLELDVLAKSLGFNTKRGSFIKDKKVKGMLAIAFSKKQNSISILTDGFEIGEDDFDIKASFTLNKEHPMMNINISTTILWANATRLLDTHLFDILNPINLTKPIAVNCSIKGDMNAEGDPEIVVVAQIKENELTIPDGKIADCNFTGKYTNNFKNGLGYNDVNSAISLNNFTGTYEGIPLVIPTAMITNLEKPIATGNLHTNFVVTKLKNIFGDDIIQFKGGNAKVDLKFNVDIVALKITKPHFNGKIILDKAELLYRPNNYKFQSNIDLDFTEEALWIKNIKLQSDRNVYFLDGKIDNFLNLYYDDPKKMVAVLNLKSPFLDAKRFIRVLSYKESNLKEKKAATKTEQNRTKALVQKCQVVLNMSISKMVYESLSAKNAKFTIFVKHRNFFLNNGSIETSGGKILFDAKLTPQDKWFNFSSHVVINTVNIPQFLTSFKNFGIQSFKPENIKGNLTATTDINGKITREGDLVDGSVKGNLKYVIKNGELNNFDPIIKVSRFAFPNRDVKHIVFNDLSGSLTMSDSKVNVDFFRVSSNVLNFDVEGIYSFKRGTNLGLTIPLRNPKKDLEIIDKKEREAKREKGIVLHLLVIDGKEGETKIKWGKYEKGK